MFYNRYAEEKLAGRGRHQPRSKSVPKFSKVYAEDPRVSVDPDLARPADHSSNDEERRYRRRDRPGTYLLLLF